MSGICVTGDNCQDDKYIGSIVGIELGFICSDRYPTENEWLNIGALRGKSLQLSYDTLDGTTDSTKGVRRENHVSYSNLSLSVDGLLHRADNLEINHNYIQRQIISGKNLNVSCWLRATYPDITIVEYVNLTSTSRDSPYDDLASFSIDAESTASMIVGDIYPTESVSLCPQYDGDGDSDSDIPIPPENEDDGDGEE